MTRVWVAFVLAGIVLALSFTEYYLCVNTSDELLAIVERIENTENVEEMSGADVTDSLEKQAIANDKKESKPKAKKTTRKSQTQNSEKEPSTKAKKETTKKTATKKTETTQKKAQSTTTKKTTDKKTKKED